MKKTLCMALLALSCFFASALEPLSAGLDAYARSDWSTAILSFRKAITLPGSGAEPWYWLVMSELSGDDYRTAMADIDRFILTFPDDARVSDITYQKGRVLFMMNEIESSIAVLDSFIQKWPEHQMVPSAYYWIGECLYASGRFEEAGKLFAMITSAYPGSVKREAALYRLALIQQTDKQDELLKLLKLSHEESLMIIEEYQRREKTYEQAITAYQKRISDMIKDTRLGDLEKQLGDEKVRNSELLDRISRLEMLNAELASSLSMSGADVPVLGNGEYGVSDLSSSDPDKRKRALESLMQKAKTVEKMYDKIDTAEGGGK
jgi:tetratricopeptide (TPR) repeat protein